MIKLTKWVGFSLRAAICFVSLGRVKIRLGDFLRVCALFFVTSSIPPEKKGDILFSFLFLLLIYRRESASAHLLSDPFMCCTSKLYSCRIRLQDRSRLFLFFILSTNTKGLWSVRTAVGCSPAVT